ncbi:hypothetical protein LINGRAHAP2_LOCUS6638 [Linum grandiflorum]
MCFSMLLLGFRIEPYCCLGLKAFLYSHKIDHALQNDSGHTRRDINGRSMKKKIDVKRRKDDTLLLLRAFDSISHMLSSLSDTIDHALQFVVLPAKKSTYMARELN